MLTTALTARLQRPRFQSVPRQRWKRPDARRVIAVPEHRGFSVPLPAFREIKFYRFIPDAVRNRTVKGMHSSIFIYFNINHSFYPFCYLY